MVTIPMMKDMQDISIISFGRGQFMDLTPPQSGSGQEMSKRETLFMEAF